MSVLARLLNIGFILAVFILDGNTPVLIVRGLDMTDMTLAIISMLISSKSVDLFRVHVLTALIASFSSAGFKYRQFPIIPPK